jgi:hypothetical protein
MWCFWKEAVLERSSMQAGRFFLWAMVMAVNT